MYERVIAHAQPFKEAQTGVMSPGFKGDRKQVEFCPWCFTLHVTRVTEENHLAVLTALAQECDGSELYDCDTD